MTDALIHAMADMQEAEALLRAKQLLDEGTDAMTILKACSSAMQTVGERFEKGQDTNEPLTSIISYRQGQWSLTYTHFNFTLMDEGRHVTGTTLL